MTLRRTDCVDLDQAAPTASERVSTSPGGMLSSDRRPKIWRDQRPGPDVLPYHNRQVVVLRPEDWAAWIYLTRPEAELLQPLPPGSLKVETVRQGSD